MEFFNSYLQIDIVIQQRTDSTLPNHPQQGVKSEKIVSSEKNTKHLTEKKELTDSLFYGVINTEKIPVRKATAIKAQEEEATVEQLFNLKWRVEQVATWQSFILVFTFFLLGLAKAFSVNRFRQTYKSIFNYRVAQEICNEEKVFFHRVNLMLMFNYLLLGSLLIFQFKEYIGFVSTVSITWGLYVGAFVFLVLLNFSKLVFTQFFAFIFDVTYFVTDYVFNVSLFNNLAGVLFIPILSIIYFTELNQETIMYYIIIPTLFILLILRGIRLVRIGTEKGVSYSYIFLYICTLEILPLVVMIKFFIFS